MAHREREITCKDGESLWTSLQGRHAALLQIRSSRHSLHLNNQWLAEMNASEESSSLTKLLSIVPIVQIHRAAMQNNNSSSSSSSSSSSRSSRSSSSKITTDSPTHPSIHQPTNQLIHQIYQHPKNKTARGVYQRLKGITQTQQPGSESKKRS